MQANRSSKTAAQMALSRALEMRRSAGERICEDPFAERFLDRRYRALLLAGVVRSGLERLVERLFPGHHHYVLARTACFDAALVEELARGLDQLVVLGAGYDSRAHRFALSGVRVFEVDHPATSAEKRATVATVSTAHGAVRYVPVDFNRDDLGTELARAGFSSTERTLFLWEGTTPYLTRGAVDGTLRFVAAHAAPGSVLQFDYILESVLDGTCESRGARAEHAKMLNTPEPFVFGLAPDAMRDFLSERGFTVNQDLGAEELRERFMPSPRRAAYVKPWWRIVRATVRS
jgi:methyltransferase (TIGR00027 family)